MQSTETTFTGLELATQLISLHASFFIGVIILGMNNLDLGNVHDQFEEANKK